MTVNINKILARSSSLQKTTPPVIKPKAWSSIASSVDGQVVYATATGDFIYVSTNEGTTWSTKGIKGAWSRVLCDDTGEHAVACINGGLCYISEDTGTTWTAIGTLKAKWSYIINIGSDTFEPAFVTSTGDGYIKTESGLKLVFSLKLPITGILPRDCGVVTSVNGGPIRDGLGTPVTGNQKWARLAGSPDGTKIIAAVNDGPIYKIVLIRSGLNSVATITPYSVTGLPPKRTWTGLAIDNGGTFMCAITGNGVYSGKYDDMSSPLTVVRSGTQKWTGVVKYAGDVDTVYAIASGDRIYKQVVEKAYRFTPRGSVRTWTGVASSADGTKLVACAQNDFIYTSTDSGVTWAKSESFGKDWRCIASSADGTKVVASGHRTYISTSIDSGVTWTARADEFDYQNWQSVASSSDGTKLVACVSGGQLYTSTDSGVTWTARESNKLWTGVASSADGVKLVACAYNHLIYTSTDSGVTWTARDSDRDWTGVASSADGTKLVACALDDRIYTSTDSGETWTARDSDRDWQSVASSADGVKLVACVRDGQLYTSTDSGVTWTARDDNKLWSGIASSADGVKLVACVDGGQLYTAPSPVTSYQLTRIDTV